MFSILFVSHDADLCAAAGRALQRAGLSARTAAHAGHASLACAETQFDVVVIENEMPEGSGKRIAARLRRYCPDLGVVVMCDRRSIVPADEIAVVRPFMADDLVEAILAALAGRQARRGATSR